MLERSSAIRVKRKMVFWFDESVYGISDSSKFSMRDREFHSFIQAGKRPFLVVSCDESNQSSNICNIIPITSSKDKIRHQLPSHVTYTYQNNINTILVEQIRTVDLITLGNYMYTVSDELMERVERSLISQFSIKSASEYLMEDMLNKLEPVINKIILDKLENSKNALSANKAEDFALMIGQNIEQIFNSNVKTVHSSLKSTLIDNSQVETTNDFIILENENDINDNIITDIIEVNAEQEIEFISDDDIIDVVIDKKENKIKNINKSTNREIIENVVVEVKRDKEKNKEKDKEKDNKISKVDKNNYKERVNEKIEGVKPPVATRKSKDQKWDDKLREQFLLDCEKFSIEEVAVLYGLATIGTVYSTKYLAKKHLDKKNK